MTDGRDRVFRNVGTENSGAVELPKIKNKSRRTSSLAIWLPREAASYFRWTELLATLPINPDNSQEVKNLVCIQKFVVAISKKRITDRDSVLFSTVNIIFFTLRTAAFKAYCAIWVRLSKFRHQASRRVSPRESTKRKKVEIWARNVRKFCLNSQFHVTFRDLMHTVNKRHGTNDFTFPPKEGVLRNFSS
jgi:hypothetical protein